MMDTLYLKELSLEFRNAIIKCGIKKLPISFHTFPQGSCSDASILLGKYLEEMGIGRFDYVSGHLGNQSHAWLEKDSVIVDITADQYDGITTGVIVSDYSAFHKRFKGSLRRAYIDSFGNGDFVDVELLPAYYKIIKYLDDKYKPQLQPLSV